MAGVDLVSVKLLLGHRNIETTMRYSHLSPDHLRQAVNKGSVIAAESPTRSVPNLVGDKFKCETGNLNRDQNRDQEATVAAYRSDVLDILVRPAGIEPATLSLEG